MPSEAPPLPEEALEERFLAATGPGGQNVNKVATAVQLRFDVGRSALAPDVKERLIALAGRRMTAEGVLVIVSRVHRSQALNRNAARTRLVTLLKRAAHPPKKRTPTRPRAAARENRLLSKKRHGTVKRNRGKHDEDDHP